MQGCDQTALKPLPTRVLGNTGVELPILGLGSACAGHSDHVTRAEAVAVYREAIDQGLFIDTAPSYGKAEELLGEALRGCRERVFLATKVSADDRAAAEASFTDSLRRLRTDHVDLLYWHCVGPRDFEHALEPDGPLAYLLEQKEAGRARFLGFTAHSHPSRVGELLETGVIDVIMAVMNVGDRHLYNFEEKLLPQARDAGVGVLAMKVLGGERGNDWSRYDGPNPGPQIPVEQVELAIRYALSLPGVHAAVVGCHTVQQVQQNAAIARRFAPLSETERREADRRGREWAAGWEPRFGPTE